MKMMLFLILTVSLNATAKDTNFLTPADLPKTTYQIYSESGRPPVPNFPAHHGEAEAMRSNYGEDHCHSKVGMQLTPFIQQVSGDTTPAPFARYHFQVSATFECLAPTLSVVLSEAASEQLFVALPISAKNNGSRQYEYKRADVVCYSSLEEVCDGRLLLGYNDLHTCDVVDIDSSSASISLVDELRRDGSIVSRGARPLEKLLPIYRDTRRSDQRPGGNCSPTIPGKLKGLERKAATIHCVKKLDAPASCEVEGIIRL